MKISKGTNNLESSKRKSMLMPASDEVITGFFKGLGDATRLKIVELLLERERNVSELSKILQVPQSNISNHVVGLRWCGCITSHKEIRWLPV